MASREYRKAYYEKRIAKYLEYLGGKCVRCGTTFDLEFDHIDRKTKSFTITAKYDQKWELLQPELDKCQLLCRPCHIAKSLECGDMPPLAVHGTHAMYRHYGCRCDECRRAKSELNRSRYKERHPNAASTESGSRKRTWSVGSRKGIKMPRSWSRRPKNPAAIGQR